MTHLDASFGPYFRSDIRAAGLVAALFAICALNLWLSFALASPAQSAELRVDLDAPRALEPRFDTESSSAPSRGRRVHSPQLTSAMSIGQCRYLTSARERQDCMVSASGGAGSYVPAVQINSTSSTVVVSGESK